ncbi:UNVERIFIED_CONTAM: hypothetical protein HDU68_008129 [Siphonaria sp. JEL0065]|nr:hypothetical protein HDU68_008129 [Siphonaria sp. JEL0065]
MAKIFNILIALATALAVAAAPAPPTPGSVEVPVPAGFVGKSVASYCKTTCHRTQYHEIVCCTNCGGNIDCELSS